VVATGGDPGTVRPFGYANVYKELYQQNEKWVWCWIEDKDEATLKAIFKTNKKLQRMAQVLSDGGAAKCFGWFCKIGFMNLIHQLGQLGKNVRACLVQVHNGELSFEVKRKRYIFQRAVTVVQKILDQ